MKIEIENSVEQATPQAKIFKVIALAKRVDSLNDLIGLLEAMENNFKDYLDFGKGSKHISVSLKSISKRILLITE